MVVYQIMEYKNCDEYFSWGIFSSEQKAKLYLEYENWDNNVDFEIIPYVLDERLKEVNCEELKVNQKTMQLVQAVRNQVLTKVKCIGLMVSYIAKSV